MPAKSLGIFYVFIREESGVAPVQRDNFRWCQVCLSSGLLTHLVSLNFWFLKLTPGGSQVTAGGSKSHGDNRHLDLDQILPRFNVQLKHNAAKWEFTLDLVSPVKRVGKIPVELLCFALNLSKNYMCCCQIIITGHCWLNKRLASQEERAMIRNNISQNWWIYYRVTKLTAFCSVNHISSLEAWHRYCKWLSDWSFCQYF